MNQRTYKKLSLVVGALLVTGALTGTAAAMITEDTGGQEVRVDKRTSDTPSTTHNTAWTTVPGTSITVHVPADQSRLYDVSFFAESQCAGAAAVGACAVRITANGAELNPVVGMDFAFDSDISGANDDLREGHAIERSRRLPGGPNGTDYVIEVQYAVTNAMTTFRLDDWHLAAHANL